MIIRAATLRDVPAILPMVKEICEQHERRDPERFRVKADVLEMYAQWLPKRIEDPRSVLLVAELPGIEGLAGYVVCTIEPEIPIFWVPECAWVHDIFVIPTARKLGVAATLLREVIRRYTAMNIRQVRLHTGSFNQDARAFFQQQGFRPSVVEMLLTLPVPTNPQADSFLG